jgi:hypothetical protein
MFKLQPAPTFRVQVGLSVPAVEKPIEISIEFKHKTDDAFHDWVKRTAQRAAVDALHEIIVSWAGVVDESGASVPYTHSNLATLLNNYPPSKEEIFLSYKKELTEAKRKN